MAFINNLVNPGVGIGSVFGTNTTAAVNSTSTYTISAGAWIGLIMAAGVNAVLNDSTNTATYTIATGATPVSWLIVSDGTNAQIRNSTTSVNVTLINIT